MTVPTPEAAEALSQAPHTFGLRGGEIAVVRTGGKAVVSARGVRKGDALEIEVADGTILGTAQSTEPK